MPDCSYCGKQIYILYTHVPSRGEAFPQDSVVCPQHKDCFKVPLREEVNCMALNYLSTRIDVNPFLVLQLIAYLKDNARKGVQGAKGGGRGRVHVLERSDCWHVGGSVLALRTNSNVEQKLSW